MPLINLDCIVMQMAGVITKKGLIPSILVDRNFLKKLGEIIEAQAKQRVEEAKAELEIKIEANKAKFHGTSKETQQAIDEMETSMRQYFRSPWNVKYRLTTSDEQELSFESVSDILNTTILPQNIEGLDVRIYHSDPDYVDTTIHLSKPNGILFTVILQKYEVSSRNVGELLRIERELRELFNQSRPNYHMFLYPKQIWGYIWIFIIAALAGLGITHLVLLNSGIHSFSDKYFLTGDLWLVYYFGMGSLLKWLFPFYEFELASSKHWKNSIRWTLGAVTLTLIGSGVYDLIKFLG